MHPNIPASLSRCAPPFFCEHSTAECSRTLCVSRADGRLGRLPRPPRPPRPDSLTKHAPAIFLAQRTSNFGAVCALNSVHALLWNPLHCKMLLLPSRVRIYRWAVVAAAPTVEPNDERPSRWLWRHASRACHCSRARYRMRIPAASGVNRAIVQGLAGGLSVSSAFCRVFDPRMAPK